MKIILDIVPIIYHLYVYCVIVYFTAYIYHLVMLLVLFLPVFCTFLNCKSFRRVHFLVSHMWHPRFPLWNKGEVFNNNYNDYLERQTRTGPKRNLHIL